MVKSLNFTERIRTLSDADLMAQVGPATWAKGLKTWRSGAVVDPQFDESGSLIGRIRESGLSYKATIIDVQGRMDMTCACRIGRDCHHCVALVLAMRDLYEQEEDQELTWKTVLNEILGDSPTEGESLAVLVDAHDPNQPIWLTPLRPGMRVAWSPKRASWPDLTSTQWESVTEGINPTHLALIREGYRLSRESNTWQSRGEVSLESLGRHGLAWLRRLHRAGVHLLADTDPLTYLTLDPTTWDLDLDAAVSDDGLHLNPIARNGETHLTTPRIVTQCSMLVLDGGTRLAEINGASTLEHFPDGGRLTIPAEDLAEFRASWLPRLRRIYSVTSRDGSFDHLSDTLPHVVATVRCDGSQTIAVRWWVEYSLGKVTSRVPAHKVREDAHVAEIFQRIDARGQTLSDPLWHRPPGVIRFPAWRTPKFLHDVVEYIDDPDLVWDIADEVKVIDVDDHATTISLDITSADSDWFDLRVQVELAGQPIPMTQLLTALAQGEEYLEIQGRWIRLEGERITALKSLLDEVLALTGDEDEGPIRLSALHVGIVDELEDIADTTNAVQQWRERIESLTRTDHSSDIDVPQCRATLRPYQIDGHTWLAERSRLGLGGILADDMGLGKTLQVLALIASMKEAGEKDSASSRASESASVSRARPVLVVAPTSVVSTWRKEAERFFPDLRVETVRETRARRTENLAEICARADVVVTTYTIARLDAQEWAQMAFAGLIIDEAQMVKNPKTAIHQALNNLTYRWCIAVTGTPVENSLSDLWSILALATPGLLPTWTTFVERFRRPIENDGLEEPLERLQRLIAPFMLRRTKEDVAPDLPDKVESIIDIDLGEEHRRLYDQYLTKQRAKILSLMSDFSKNRMNVLAAITRLRQLALDPALVSEEMSHVGSAKVEYLADQLAQIVPRGHRALIFSQFTTFLDRIRQTLERRNMRVVQLDGTTRNRDAVIDQFRSGEAPVFLISLKAGGTGLTLTEADYVYVMDPWWNPAAEAQAVDRAHRIGQRKKVNVYRLVASGTIEQKVVDLQERKRALVSSVIDGQETSLRINVQDLRDLLDD
ncbi:DEAD/DEAH box helicase [Schaalia sp. ZJ1691]|uniref:DEAD/DEAH box helicase n=1 Tax=Schaalia sp. ZJ1691 TaxID=2709404 RepID=UPI0013EE2144|nr:DEAD/DEAH box helicase [Schaalia sp. ZJ1691]